jgi:ribonuclease P protein component
MAERPSRGRAARRRRLSRSAEFERVYRQGSSKANRFLVLYAFLREAFWAEAERLPPGADYVVVARPEARGLAEREGMPGVRTALAELVEELGGRPEADAA